MTIPFNRPHINGRELSMIASACEQRTLAGDGPRTRACQQTLSGLLNGAAVFLTHSGTAALELALLALDLRNGDEVVVPSFTFVSCANAVLLAGGTPVFADIAPGTQNLCPESLRRSLSTRTKAVIVVHYGGISSDLDQIIEITRAHGCALIEDAAHCLGATLHGRELGTFGDFGCFSFHETKNITCGEGGAIVVNDPARVARIEIMREKGTDRSRFRRREVDRYTWLDRGSSYLPNEITAAFLAAQLGDLGIVTESRRTIWREYHRLFETLERRGRVARPVITSGSTPNGHLYYLLMRSETARQAVIEALAKQGIQAVSHYVPLHSSPYGRQFRTDPNGLPVTEQHAVRLLRLPVWVGLDTAAQQRVAEAISAVVDQ